MNILVTGGAGFIGSHVVDALLQMESRSIERVIVLDDLSGGIRRNLTNDPRVSLAIGSVTDEALIDRLFCEYRFRFVYHLAAYAAEGLSHFIRKFNYTNNLLGSVNLINASVNYGTECFIFTSSVAVYGNGDSPLLETTTPVPVDPYGIAKYAIELDLATARKLFGLDFVIFRPHNVYGERQNLADKYRNVAGIFMNRLLHDLPMPIFGDGNQVRAFSYVGDVAPVIAAAPWVSDARGESFNLGSDNACTVNELAGMVADAIGKPDLREYHPARHEVRVAFCDHQKAQRTFLNLQNTLLLDGLKHMANWAKTTEITPSQTFEFIEIERNLPESWKS